MWLFYINYSQFCTVIKLKTFIILAFIDYLDLPCEDFKSFGIKMAYL